MLKKKIILGGLILASLIVGITNADITVPLGTCAGPDNAKFCLSDNGDFSGGDLGNIWFYSMWNSANYKMGYTWHNGKLLNYAGYTKWQWLFGQNNLTAGFPKYYCQTGYNGVCNEFCENGYDIENLYRKTLVVDSITWVGYNTFNNGNQSGPLCFNVSSPEQITYCIPGARNSTNSYPNNCSYGSDLFEPLEGGPYAFTNEIIQTKFMSGEGGFRGGGAGPDTEGGPISCINIKSQIMLYGANYNTGLCYTNGIEFSGNQIINTGKLSIFEVYPTYQDYKEALNLYNTYCSPTSPSTPEYCQQVMQGHQPEYTWQFVNSIKNMDSNMIFTVTTQKLYQYCHLQLNFTEEEKRTECKDTVENYYATGITEESDANGNPFEGISDRVDNNIQIAVPTTGTVFDEFLDGDTRIVGITDRYGNFKEIYHKIMGLFKYRNTQQGIIPGYITAMIMLILLLAIIKK